MKRYKKILIITLIFSLIGSTNVLAEEGLRLKSKQNSQSVLLNPTVTSASDIFKSVLRGEIFSTAMIEIVNKQNGDIFIRVDTFAHHNVDRIYHAVFLDRWDPDRKDWSQVGFWEFEDTKDGKEKFSLLTTSFTVSGYQLNKYYRVRGLHLVEYLGNSEAGSTETDGILITDHPT